MNKADAPQEEAKADASSPLTIETSAETKAEESKTPTDVKTPGSTTSTKSVKKDVKADTTAKPTAPITTRTADRTKPSTVIPGAKTGVGATSATSAKDLIKKPAPTTTSTLPSKDVKKVVAAPKETTADAGTKVDAGKLDGEVKKLQEELELVRGALESLQNDHSASNKKVEDLELQLSARDSKIASLQQEIQASQNKGQADSEALAKEHTEYKKKYQDAFAKTQELQRANKELETKLNSMNREMKDNTADNDKIQRLEDMIEKLSMEKEDLANNNEILSLELEEALIKNKELQEEKELQELEAEERILSANDDADVGTLKMKNLKLEQALAALYKKYESEKQIGEEKVKRLNEKIALIPKIEEKDKQIQDLTDTLKKKENEIVELKYTVDEAADSTNMIEEMSTQIMQKDDEIIEMRRELTALKKNQEADREIQDEQDDYIKILERDIQDRDYKIVVLTQSIVDHQNVVEDKEKQYNKLKDRLTNINNELTLYKEQNTDVEKTNTIKRIDDLLARQHDLSVEYSRMYREYIGAMAQLLKIKSELARYTIMVGPLPQDFLKKLHLQPLGKYIQTLIIRERAGLLINELLSKYVKRNENPIETKELQLWVFAMIKLLVQLVSNCALIERIFIKFEFQNDATKYEQFSKNPVFNQIFALNSFVEQVIGHIREDTLTHKIPQDSFKMVMNKLQEICESLAETENVSLTELHKDILSALYAFVPFFEAGAKKNLSIKSVCDPFHRCADFFQSFIKQFILGTIGEYGAKNENNLTNLKILEKHLKGGVETLKKTAEFNDVVFCEQLDSILNRLFVYPPIEDEKETEIQKIALRGPWAKINEGVQHEINQIGVITQSLESTTNELKEQISNTTTLNKEIKDLNSIRDTLEKRVAELQIKSEKVVLLENEKKRALEKEHHLTESSNRFKRQIEILEKRTKELEDENKDLKERGPDEFTNASSLKAKRNWQSILPKTGGRLSVGNRVANLAGSSDEGISSSLANILGKLNAENFQLRTKQIRDRVNKLDNSMPAFKRLLQEYRSKQEDINDDETQANLEALITTQNSLNKHKLSYLSKPQVIVLDNISNLSKAEKVEAINTWESKRKENLESVRYEASMVSINLIKVINKERAKKSFRNYLSSDIQTLLERNSAASVGQIDIQTTGSSEQASQNVDIFLTNNHINRLKELVL